jgi:hypothetical protein
MCLRRFERTRSRTPRCPDSRRLLACLGRPFATSHSAPTTTARPGSVRWGGRDFGARHAPANGPHRMLCRAVRSDTSCPEPVGCRTDSAGSLQPLRARERQSEGQAKRQSSISSSVSLQAGVSMAACSRSDSIAVPSAPWNLRALPGSQRVSRFSGLSPELSNRFLVYLKYWTNVGDAIGRQVRLGGHKKNGPHEGGPL